MIDDDDERLQHGMSEAILSSADGIFRNSPVRTEEDGAGARRQGTVMLDVARGWENPLDSEHYENCEIIKSSQISPSRERCLVWVLFASPVI